jgi:DNA-binding GntR family transcriptional regulator
MPRGLLIPDVTLDRSHVSTLPRQIHSQIAFAIRSGGLPAGARLPSSRIMAKLLRVSRNTVVTAYDDLIADGLLHARPGSGIRVATASRAALPGLTNLKRAVRSAHYPARTLVCEDPDGTLFYLNMRRP